MAIIGIILAAVTKITVPDITGGVPTGVGLLFAGISAGMQRRKIMNGYDEEIVRGRKRMQEALDSKLRVCVRTIKSRIRDNFAELDALLGNENKQIAHYKMAFDTLSIRLAEVDKQLKIN